MTRPRDIRARTVSRISKRDLAAEGARYPELILRPRTRAQCESGLRPCPYVSCRHHLFLDVSPRTGSIKLNFPDLEPGDLEETCALDVADQGGVTLERAGELINLTRERVRQVEVGARDRLRSRLRVYADGSTPDAVIDVDALLDEIDDAEIADS